MLGSASGTPDRVPEVLKEIKMRKILTIISVSVLFSGCCTNGSFCNGKFAGGACGDNVVDGYTRTAIVYGEGTLVVVPISTIKPNTEWRFYLAPANLGGAMPPEDTIITIKGQDPADPPLTSLGDNTWINVSGKYGSANKDGRVRYLAQCTPETLVQGDYHKFEITVEGIGNLDPRGHVE